MMEHISIDVKKCFSGSSKVDDLLQALRVVETKKKIPIYKNKLTRSNLIELRFQN